MNSCILMAEIVEAPQLRYTTDNLALTEMLVQFQAQKAEERPATLKVVGWGNLAQEIEQKYQKGDRIIIEGRLSMNTVQMDGYKEKKAELTVQKIHTLGEDVSIGASLGTTATSSYPTNASAGDSRMNEPEEKPAAVALPTQQSPVKTVAQPKTPLPTPDTDVDDIPF